MKKESGLISGVILFAILLSACSAPGVIASPEKTNTHSTMSLSSRPSGGIVSAESVPSSTEKTAKKETSELGNSVGNYANSGLMAEKDGWVYYNDSGGLFRRKTDDSMVTLISEHPAFNISVVGDWVYFLSSDAYSDKTWLYKVKTDGTNEEKIKDANVFAFLWTSCLVIDDKIYYVNNNDQNRLYSMKTDGSEITRLTNTLAYPFISDGKWIFAITSELDELVIRKLSMDGIYKSKLADASSSSIFIPYQGWVYYTDPEMNFYRIRYDGTLKEKVAEWKVNALNIYGDRLYFVALDEGISTLYSSDLEGKDRIQMARVSANNLQIAGGWIYGKVIGFYKTNDSNFRIKLDGTQLEINGGTN